MEEEHRGPSKVHALDLVLVGIVGSEVFRECLLDESPQAVVVPEDATHIWTDTAPALIAALPTGVPAPLLARGGLM